MASQESESKEPSSNRPEMFEELVQRMCAEDNCEYPIVFYTRIDTDVSEELGSERSSYEAPAPATKYEIVISNLYENDRMKELRMYKQRLPAVLLTVLAELLPSHSPSVRLDLRRCSVSETACAGALGSLLRATSITDVCLDGTCLRAGDYHLLLENTRLRHLSLARCSVDDQAAQEMALRLRFGAHCGDHLETLNLTGNCVTDAGAAAIADALRFNLKLRYLNLSGNYIGDEGGNDILGALDCFQPPDDVMVDCRKKYFSYLKRKQELIDEYNAFNSATQVDILKKTSSALSTKKMSVLKKDKIDPKIGRLDKYLNGMLGKFEHPFMKSNIFVKDDIYWCYGNRVLSYLNLAFNKLSYVFLLKLHRVLISQESIRSPNHEGLVVVIIEGNHMPLYCPELDAVNELILRKYNKAYPKTYDKKKGKT